MSDYISRETARSVFSAANIMRMRYMTVGEILDEIALLPTADVAEVVRCMDCVHAPLPGNERFPEDMKWPKIDGVFIDTTCPYYCDDNYYSERPDPDWFCNKGEKK